MIIVNIVHCVYMLAALPESPSIPYTMASSEDEDTLTATSGSDFDFDSEQTSDIESSASGSDINVPLARPRKRAGTAPDQDLQWKNTDNFPRRYGFGGASGLQVQNLDSTSSPMEIFEHFFPPELIRHISDETNRYAADNPKETPSHMKEWFNTTQEEMSVFMAMIILMGIMPKPNMKLYWTRDSVLETPFFPNTMPRDRFMALLAYLHFADNNHADVNDRLYKIRPVVSEVTDNFKSVYIPSSQITTDESLWKFKGRLKFKQYNPNKRARFGIKVYRVCQSTGAADGYTWNLKIYTGQDKTDTPASTKIVLDLNEDLLGKGYTIFLDNWFSSPFLFQELHSKRTNVVGTVRKNRKNMPKDLRNLKLKKGEVDFRSSDNGLLALVWKDKKDVRMLSTMHTASMEDTGKHDRKGNPITKPMCVIEYNNGMKGVDLADQLASSHRSVEKVHQVVQETVLLSVGCLLGELISCAQRTGWD